MKRRAFNVLAAVSLVMAIAVVGLWARSVWWTADWFVYRTDSNHWAAASRQGRFYVRYSEYPIVGVHGFSWAHDAPSAMVLTSRTKALEVASWFPALIFFALPAAWLVMRLRRRKAVGLCANCGYDLRGSPGPACPECGTVIPAKAVENSN